MEYLVSPTSPFFEAKALLEKESEGRHIEISEMGPFLLGRSESELGANARLQLTKLGQPGTPSDLIKRLRSKGAFCGTPDEFLLTLKENLESGISKFYFQALVPENRTMTELLSETIESVS